MTSLKPSSTDYFYKKIRSWDYHIKKCMVTISIGDRFISLFGWKFYSNILYKKMCNMAKFHYAKSIIEKTLNFFSLNNYNCILAWSEPNHCSTIIHIFLIFTPCWNKKISVLILEPCKKSFSTLYVYLLSVRRTEWLLIIKNTLKSFIVNRIFLWYSFCKKNIFTIIAI